MADDSPDQIFEDFQDIVQQAILTGFPNPERKGCLDSTMLKELANRPRPVRDAAWEHVTHCSPCYREFLEFRAEVKRARRSLVARRRLMVSGVAAALVIAAGITTYEVAHRGNQSATQTGGPYQSAALDLKDRSVARGEAGHSPRTEPLVLPSKPLDLTIYLPIGSEPGVYQVQLLKKIDEPLMTVVGEARVEHGNTILRARIDLTHIAFGAVLIGLRQPPSDWTYYPVSIH
jgi:hypothetical protein